MREEQLPVNLGDLLKRPGLGERTALVDLRNDDQPVHLTADELAERVHTFAASLRQRGLQPGARVGFLSDNRWEILVGYLGTMVAGAVAVPINHKFPPATVDFIIEDSDVELVFFDQQRSRLIPDSVAAISFDDADGEGFRAFSSQATGDSSVYEPRPGDLAEILYTSGSTGQPKGVPLDHAGQLWALFKYLESFEPGRASGASLIVAPLYHMNALFFSSVCLLNSMTIVLQPRFNAARYIAAVARYRCTHLSGVPTMFALVAALDDRDRDHDFSFVESVFIGSAPLSETLLEQVRGLFPRARVSNGYGTTEAGPAVFGPHPDGKPRPPMSIGYPYHDVEWRLVNGPSAHEGELELRTSALTRGYINRPEASAERFVDGWYRTNDVMKHDDEGFFYFVSRADDMFVCGGENIYPRDVEEVVNSHPAVRDSVVVGAPDDIKGQVPVAFVVALPVASPGPELEDDIKQHCLSNAPPYLHPRRVVFLDSLPVGGTHKIDRRELENTATTLMIEAGRATPSASEPQA